MPEGTTPARVSTIRLLVVAVLLTFSGATLAGSMVPARDGLHRTHNMLQRQRDRNEQLTRRLEELRLEEHSLETEPWLTKRILVDAMRITEPGEVTVR